MTQDELNTYLNKYIGSGVQNNISEYTRLIQETVDFNASPNDVAIKAALAGATFAMRISSEMVLKILNELNVINIEELEYYPPKPDFKLMSGGLDETTKP